MSSLRFLLAGLLTLTLISGSKALFADSKSEMRVWTSRSVDLGRYDRSGAPASQKFIVSGFYPLGFSKDGWFAYTAHPEGNQMDPLFSLTNIRCEGGHDCVTDTPSHKGDICYCPTVTGMKDLARFKIQPFPALEHGSFPAKISNREYEVKLIEKEKMFPSEATPVTYHPGVEVILLSKGQGEKAIDGLDYNHSGALRGSLQVAGWMATPDRDKIVVVMGYMTRDGIKGSETNSVFFYPVVVGLNSGFKK